METSSIDLATVPVPAPGLVIRPAGSESLVHDPVSGQIHVLNGTAARILQRCDGTASLEQIVDELVAAAGVDRLRVERDVASIYGTFQARGLVS